MLTRGRSRACVWPILNRWVYNISILLLERIESHVGSVTWTCLLDAFDRRWKKPRHAKRWLETLWLSPPVSVLHWVHSHTLYVCMRMCMCMCKYVHVISMCVCVCVGVCSHNPKNCCIFCLKIYLACVCLWVFMWAFVCVCMCVCLYVHIYTHVHGCCRWTIGSIAARACDVYLR